MKRIIVAVLACMPILAHADRLSLTWSHPMSGAVAYNVYCGTDPVRRVTAPPYVLEKTGTWTGRCAVTALNAGGAESDRSAATGEIRCVAGVCTVPPDGACAAVVVPEPEPVPTPPPAPRYTVAPNGTYPTRPVYDTRAFDDSQGATRREIGRVPVGQECGDASLISGRYNWRRAQASNGTWGIALCTEAP